MSPETYRIFAILLLAWSGASAIKAILALREGKPYTFALWDGGMLRSGKSIGPGATKVRLAVSLALAIVTGGVLGGVFPPRIGGWLIVALAVVSLLTSLGAQARKE